MPPDYEYIAHKATRIGMVGQVIDKATSTVCVMFGDCRCRSWWALSVLGLDIHPGTHAGAAMPSGVAGKRHEDPCLLEPT